MRFRPAVPVLALFALAALAVPAAPREADGREPERGAAGAEEATSVSELVTAAERAISRGRAEEAVALYRRAVEAAPDAPRLVAALGRSLALADRYGEAAEVLERAVALGAGDARTRFYLGSALWESGRYEPAEAVLRRAAEEAAGTGAEPVTRQQLGRLLLWTGRPEDAVAPLERVVGLRPGAADARLDLARALEGAGRTEEALAAYRRVTELAPDSHYARWGLAQLLARTGRREEAAEELEVYRRLYEADQERTRRSLLEESEIDRGWHLLRSGRPAAAEEVFRGLVRGLGGGSAALVGLARAQAAQGDHSGAAATLERAVALEPDRPDLRRALAEARLAADGEREDGDG